MKIVEPKNRRVCECCTSPSGNVFVMQTLGAVKDIAICEKCATELGNEIKQIFKKNKQKECK